MTASNPQLGWENFLKISRTEKEELESVKKK